MKNIFTKLMLVSLTPLAAYGQTIVSTTPQNRKAILEEFTGVNCVYCPQGHAIAEQILENNPGNAFAINIHQGGYATPGGSQPDFRTPFGNAIAGQTGLTGYPAGTVNRHVFPGHEMGADGTTAMDRGQWIYGANQIIAMPSYLNMAVEASIDIDARLLTVHVESYYTANSPQSSNFLNVALLQNNTLGPQTGGNQGNNYNHMRRLIYMVTGQWGEEITTTSQGTFIDKTYTYTIPEAYNNIDAILSEMEIVVFMTETQQEIISGNGAFPSLIGLEFQNDASIVSIDEILPTCTNLASPVIEIENNGENPITSATIQYSINSGEVHTYNWTGNLTSLHKATIELPEIEFNLLAQNTVNVSIAEEDQNSSNNSISSQFARANNVESSNLTLEINTDNNGAQTRWIIRNSNGQMVIQGNGYANNQTYTVAIELPGDDCYSFTLLDTGGNGGATIQLIDAEGNVVINSDGNYGSGFTIGFSKGILGTQEATLTEVEVYPNPSTGLVYINAKMGLENIYVYDITGRLLRNFSNTSDKVQIDLSAYGKGAYVIKMSNGKEVVTKKVIIK